MPDDFGEILAALQKWQPDLSENHIRAPYPRRLGGTTNRSYRVSILGSPDIVVRLPGRGSNRFVRRQDEFTNEQIAQSPGLRLLPATLYCDPTSGVRISHYLETGQALTAESVRHSQNLYPALAILRRLHRSGRRFEGQLDPLRALDNLLRCAPPTWQFKLKLVRRRCLHRHKKHLARASTAKVPCHGDPHAANFVRSVKLYLLDWEYAGMGDPLWDLAAMAVEAEFSRTQRRRMLGKYSGERPSSVEPRWHAFVCALTLIAAAWGAARLTHAESVVDKRYAQRRLIQASRLARHRTLRNFIRGA